MEQENIASVSTDFSERPNVILSRRRRWVVTAGVLLGMFLAALEATVVGTAMPTVIASLGGLDRYSWVFSAYLLASTVTVPVWGKLSDLYGRRPLYLVGVVLFLLGSALSGAAQTIDQLIVFRAIQGAGAGALIPLSLTINGDIYTISERARMQGLFSGVWGLASILGPIAGGFITDNLTWRWVFYINIPFGLAAAFVVGIALIEPKRTERPVIDYAGAAWLTISITLLLLALVESGDKPWTSAVVVGPLIGFVLFGLLFIRTERRAAEPIVPFSLFRNRIVTVGSIIGFMIGTAMFGAISFIPLYVQGTLGGTATQAGSVLTPFLLGWVTLAIVGGRLMFSIGYRRTVLSGLVIVTIGFAILATFGRGTPLWWLLVDMGLMGSGMGLVVLALLITMQNSVNRRQLGIVTSLNQFSRSIGGAVGVAIMGAVLSMSLTAHLYELQVATGLPQEEVARIAHNPSALIEPASRAALPETVMKPMEAALGGALHNVFLVGTIFAALGLASGFWLPSSYSRGGAEPARAEEHLARTPAECERLLMAEMATLDAEHEPSAVEE
ncbi:MAG TPA: MDR family MFS transporter [Blastocatellia bacterium]|jgi:EmrB/QacA subfamily drug resistance transporter|nr:MDR family MFS transporter [Blastocatellia bacterium]